MITILILVVLLLLTTIVVGVTSIYRDDVELFWAIAKGGAGFLLTWMVIWAWLVKINRSSRDTHISL